MSYFSKTHSLTLCEVGKAIISPIGFLFFFFRLVYVHGEVLIRLPLLSSAKNLSLSQGNKFKEG